MAVEPRFAPTSRWRDRKRYLWILGAVIPLVLVLAVTLVRVTGRPVFWYFGPIFVFGIVPLIDLIVGLDSSNPPDEAIETLENDRYYRWVTYAFLPVQFAMLILACWLISRPELTTSDRVGVALSLGMIAGISINTAHELGHKKPTHERWLAKIALAQTFYGHFYIEHNRGHHVRVATPDDPASSRLGESVWAFLPRSVVGSFMSAWRLERRRLTRGGSRVWTLRNDILNAGLIAAVLWIALIGVFGVRILPYLILQAVAGIWLLESINYLEHYGMLRRTLPTGRYERVTPAHSWNSNHLATNLLLYHLQRHSDHHANPTRPYQALRDFPEAPALPTGYAGMIILTWIPAVWRRVMDPRVLAHYDGDVTRANLHPAQRAKILARYGAPVPAGPAAA